MANETKDKAKEQKTKNQPGKDKEAKKADDGQKEKVKAAKKPSVGQEENEVKNAKEEKKSGKSQDSKEEKKDEKESVLKDIMSISGHSGLFKFISQARNGIIVENLETKKRIQAFATMKVSSLEEIAIFTDDEEEKLEEVLKKIFTREGGKPCIDHKSDPALLKSYFEEVLPEYDRERVYVSDIKKVVHWYNLLLQFDILKFEETGTKKVTSDK